jgi:striatin 1/3/4
MIAILLCLYIFSGGTGGSAGREGDEESLALGELAQLSVTNEAEAYDLLLTKVSFRKTWNAKYTLRSHFDGVCALIQ